MKVFTYEELCKTLEAMAKDVDSKYAGHEALTDINKIYSAAHKTFSTVPHSSDLADQITRIYSKYSNQPEVVSDTKRLVRHLLLCITAKVDILLGVKHAQ